MKGPFELFETVEELEVDGVWLSFGDFEIRVARAGGHNLRYKEVISERAMKRAEYEDEDDQSLNDNMAEVFALAIVTGWRSKLGSGVIPGKGGEPLTYTLENCEWLLKKLPDLTDWLAIKARSISTYRAEQVEKAVGEPEDGEAPAPGN